MQLTQEQLAELIAKIITNVGAARDARKEAGEEITGEITMDEILSEITNIVGEIEDGVPGVKEEEPVTASNALNTVSPEVVAKVIEALGVGGLKSAETLTAPLIAEPISSPTPSQAAAPSQRKYADLFISKGAARDGEVKSNSFKSRISSMSEPERKNAIYGMFGRAVKCINAANGDVERAAYTAEHKFMDSVMAREFKALSATNPSDGGYLIPEVYANEVIELLYPSTVIYALGARRLGMPNGNLNIPKIKTGSRALYVGENRKSSKSHPKYGNLKLSAKKLTALIPMSNDLLRSTNFDNDIVVGQDITRQMALGVDWGALFGNGSEFQPLGIVKNPKVMNIDVTNVGEEYASSAGMLTASFPNYLVASVLKHNVYADGLGFVFNTSIEQYFKSLRDNVGGFIFADEMNRNGTLAGYPYKATNLVETVNGKTQIIFGNWNDLIIGEQGALEIDTSREGSWTNDDGELVSAFENDQTLIRAINNVDMGLRHDESFAVATKVAVPV